MDILFISQYYPDELCEKCKNISKIGLNWAAHNLSKAIIQGIQDNKQPLHVINLPPMGSFPPYCRTPRIPGCTSEYMESYPYLNISYLKRLDTCNKVVKGAKKWCATHSGKKIILFYSFNYLDAVIKIKKEYPEAKVVLLVTDLPEYRTPHQTLLTRINNKISPQKNVSRGRRFDYIDGYILLASGMKDRLPVGKKPWIIVEGIYNNEAPLNTIERDTHKIVMYTGNLGARYGIRELLDAFSTIQSPEYRLWIRGDGELSGLVKSRAAQDSRIKYMGRMSREELMEYQQRATLMINPVSSSQDFTNYFFPSKTLEYMASATPTLMSKLNCLPEEYHEHLYFFEDDSPVGIAEAIQKICELPEQKRAEFGRSASNFIFKQKSPNQQMHRVIGFFDHL